MTKDKDTDKNPFVAIGSSLGGIFLVIVIMFVIFAKEQIQYLVPLAWAYVVLGCCITFFVYLTKKK